MIDPIQKLADIYPALENGQKAKAREVKAAIEEMQARLADLESTLQRQPLPEAPASMTAKVIDQTTQIEWLVTVREARAGVVLISAMPSINEALAERGLIAPGAYADGRRTTDRTTGEKALPGPNGPDQPAKQPAIIQGTGLTFKAEILEKTTKGDKTYYKVKGGKFTKFGVTVWPEVLIQAGYDLDTLTGITGMTGYTAHYILNEKGDPAKVIGLEPA